MRHRSLIAIALAASLRMTEAQVVPPPAAPPPAMPPQAVPSTPLSPYQSTPITAPGMTLGVPGDLQPKNPLLLALVIQPLLQQSGMSLASGVGALFSRLFSALGGHRATPTGTAPTAFMPGSPAAPGTYALPGAASGVPLPGPSGTVPPGASFAATKAAVVPSMLLSVQQLDPSTYAVRKHLDLSQGAPELRTGDVFAIEYSINVSGQVRIDNIDANGTVTPLGTYVVLSGRDNRIPRTKGIKLVGSTGTETFKLYFLPCAAADSNGHPDDTAAAAALPACPPGPSPSLQRASKGLIVAKGALNLESPDPTIAISAVTDFKPADVTERDFQIRHLAADPPVQ